MTIAGLLLLTRFSYSQTVLIDDSSKDTLVCITIPQMDRIYIELIQKDSLAEQAEISHATELLLYQAIDSAKKNIEMQQMLIYTIDAENMGLHADNDRLRDSVRTNRTISFITIVTLFLFIAL
jgi:hypothetical protein